jgi:hypothetical protein
MGRLMIDMKQFEDENGKLDWKAYRHAQVMAGERCSRCGAYIVSVFRKIEGPAECAECKNLTEKGEVSHSTLLRCPECSNSWKPEEQDDYHVYEEGEHEVTCYDCDHSFEISTQVSFEFTSPEKEEEND